MIPTHEPWRRGTRNSKERIILMEPIQVGLFCILPPVIAIGLALITKEVLSSLMIGILSGTLIYALNTGAGPVSAVSSAFTIMAEEFSASMIIFLCLLGGLVAVISMPAAPAHTANGPPRVCAAAKVRSLPPAFWVF